MPKGCAGAIKQGATFEDFAVRSAAVFFSEMSPNSPLANLQFEDESPLAAELAGARAYLETLAAMGDAEAQAEANTEYAVQCAQREAIQHGRNELRQRYEYAIARLQRWNPDAAFQAMKDRMFSEITESIACDCRECAEPAPVQLTATQWRVQKMTEQTLLIAHIERRNNFFMILQALRKDMGIESNAPT